jgi:Sigma-70 region 2
VLTRVRAGDGDAFRELTEPFRRELQLHCYRILDSVQDAEDAVQETLLAAWRGIGQFEGRTQSVAAIRPSSTSSGIGGSDAVFWQRDGGMLARAGVETQHFHAQVALVLEWFRLCLRHAGSEGRHAGAAGAPASTRRWAPHVSTRYSKHAASVPCTFPTGRAPSISDSRLHPPGLSAQGACPS